VEFLSNLNVKLPLHESKAPSFKHKVPLLTTFWRRFCRSYVFESISSARIVFEPVQR